LFSLKILLDRLIDVGPLKISNNHVNELAKASLAICPVPFYAGNDP
jgi:hypothetical protein